MSATPKTYVMSEDEVLNILRYIQLLTITGQNLFILGFVLGGIATACVGVLFVQYTGG